MTEAIGAAVEDALSRRDGGRVTITRRSRLGGGSINRTELVETTAGAFVLKSNPDTPPGFFRAEADGLDALRASGTSLVIPGVIARQDSSPSWLLVEALRPGPRVADFDDRLGRGLADLHRHTASSFGFAEDNFCGLSPQKNGWRESWPHFYVEARLRPQVERAARAGLLNREDCREIDALVDRVDAIVEGTTEPPSLIHGDLWSGNLHVTPDGRPALIDPAVSFSHREAELGMMTLFGGFSRRVFDAYEEAFPLPSGWRARVPLYQLYHLLNHLNLFGAGYYEGVLAAVRKSPA